MGKNPRLLFSVKKAILSPDNDISVKRVWVGELNKVTLPR